MKAVDELATAPLEAVGQAAWADGLPVMLTLGAMTLVSFYAGRAVRRLRLPSIIGYMLVGVALGPSALGLIHEDLLLELGFITELALAFVAFSIGLELRFSALRSLGTGIVAIIFAESFAAFFVVAVGIYLLTGDAVMALVFGALAPASAPAGTVAVIRECQARGSLTRALYAVVGFDDGLAIIIFGFASSIARILLAARAGDGGVGFWEGMATPLQEISFSLLLGALLGVALGMLVRHFQKSYNILILITAFVLLANGLCEALHLSLILTNMVIGLFLVNAYPHEVIARIHDQLSILMPMFFVLFFSLAGAQLHLGSLPSLGVLGLVYVLCRSAGLIGGARLGGSFGNLEEKVKKWIGLGILSQAGVAIGLALIVKQEYRDLGPLVTTAGGDTLTAGALLGATVITTVTATSVIFEIIGPILTRVALVRAGEASAAGSNPTPRGT